MVIVLLGVAWVQSERIADFLGHALGRDRTGEPATEAEPEAAAEGEESEPGMLVDPRLVAMGRVTFAMAGWMESLDPSAGPAAVRAQYAALGTSDDPVERLCAAALDARYGDPEDALARTRALAADPADSPELAAAAERQAIVIAAIAARARGEQAASVDPAQMEALQGAMGWYGSFLADTLQPDESFRRAESQSAAKLVGALGGFLCLASLAGIVGLVWLAVIGWRALSRPTLMSAAPPADAGDRYAWTFIAVFGIMVGLHAVLLLAVGRAGATAEPAEPGVSGIALQCMLMLLPMVGLAWACRGGRTWAQVRTDVGLTAGRGVLAEVGHGVLAWCGAIPLAVVGAAVAFVLSLLTDTSVSSASHPIQQAIAEGGVVMRVMLLVLAAAVAPLVEEIAFRGVLFRHLRERLGGAGNFLAFAGAATLSSILFAAIHPQGLVFAPILAGLGFAFCIAREVRGSLIAPMTAHAINNALIVGLNVVLFS